MTFTTAAFDRSSSWRFEAFPYRTAPKGPPSSLVHPDALALSGPKPSRPGEFHPEPLTEPDLTLSRHPARATERRLPPSIEHRGPPVAGWPEPNGDDPRHSLHGHYPASSLQRNRLSAAARFRRRGNDLRAFHSLWVGKAGGELLRSSPPLAGASVLSASRFEPLAPCMGLFLSRGFGTPAHLLHQFLCSIRKPFLRPEPRFAHAVARRRCQGWPSHHPSGMLRPCQARPCPLRARRHAWCGRDGDQRGARF